MRKAELILIIFLLSLVTSCAYLIKATDENVIGSYYLDPIFEIRHSITLNDDHTFIYEWQKGLAEGTTKGTWRLRKRIVILNSEYQQSSKGIKKFKLSSFKKKNLDSLKIRILNNNGMPLPFSICSLIKDSQVVSESVTDTIGIATLPFTSADILSISLFCYEDIQLELNGTHNFYEIEIAGVPDNYEYFNDKRLIFKRNRLYDTSILKNEYIKSNYYKKYK